MAQPTHYRIASGRPRLRRGHAMTAGLKGAWCLVGGYGQDLIGSNHLTPGGTVGYDGVFGMGTTVASAYYQCSANSVLQLQPPITIVWQGSFPFSGTRTANSQIFGVSYTNADTTPFSAYQFAVDNSGFLALNKNQAGTFGQLFPGGLQTPPVGARTWIATVLKSGNSLTYVDNPASSGRTDTAVTAINYGTTPILSFGTPSYVSRNSLCSHEYGLIYNYSLPLKSLQWLYSNGLDLFARKRDWAGYTAALAAGASLSFLKHAGPGGRVSPGVLAGNGSSRAG